MTALDPQTARIMGLNVVGLDILRSNHGPVVMEVNSSPGLQGIETASGKNIGQIVIEFIEKNAKSGKTKTLVGNWGHDPIRLCLLNWDRVPRFRINMVRSIAW